MPCLCGGGGQFLVAEVAFEAHLGRCGVAGSRDHDIQHKPEGHKAVAAGIESRVQRTSERAVAFPEPFEEGAADGIRRLLHSLHAVLEGPPQQFDHVRRFGGKVGTLQEPCEGTAALDVACGRGETRFGLPCLHKAVENLAVEQQKGGDCLCID